MHDDLPEQPAAAGYRIERLLGVGGMAAVYEARRLGPRGPGERVACKVMHGERPGQAAAARAQHLARRWCILARHQVPGDDIACLRLLRPPVLCLPCW